MPSDGAPGRVLLRWAAYNSKSSEGDEEKPSLVDRAISASGSPTLVKSDFKERHKCKVDILSALRLAEIAFRHLSDYFSDR
jgi:hypothetical protein